MQFASYNIQFCRGRDGRIDLDRIAAAVAGADVIALQEVDRRWQRTGGIDQALELVALLGDYHWAFGASASLDGGGPPGRASGLERREFGNMLLARAPILSARNHLLSTWSRLDGLSRHCAALEGVVLTLAGPLRVLSLHLSHLAARYRNAQIRELLALHRAAPHAGAPISAPADSEWHEPGAPDGLPAAAIMMGDFNLEADTEEYALLAGPASAYDGGRVVEPDGFVDAWVAARHRDGAAETADIDGRPVRIDYQFVHASLAHTINGARIDNDAAGSDHQPIFAELELGGFA